MANALSFFDSFQAGFDDPLVRFDAVCEGSETDALGKRPEDRYRMLKMDDEKVLELFVREFMKENC